jgi:hypothetical protein
MKRSFQIFAVLLIALLVAGPALAEACTLSDMSMGALCPMGMAGMGVDCPMLHRVAGPDCSQDCCNRPAPQAIVIPGFPVKPKFQTVTQHLALLATPPATETASTLERAPLRVAASPPRYILFRVFRI